MDSYEEHMKEELTDGVKLWKDQIFKQAEKIFKTDNNKAVNDMWIRNVGDFKNVLKNWLIKKLGGHIESDVEILRDRIINDVLDNPTIYEMARRYKDDLHRSAS